MTLLRVGLCPALTEETLDALNTAGIKTVLEFVCADVEDLAQKCSISYKVLQSIRRLLLAQYSSFPINGADLHDDVMSSIAILSTGCTSLDELLDGGLYTSELTEVTGGPATGKTQLCMTAAANITAAAQQNVLYIDTNGGFSSQRLQDVMAVRGHSDKVMAAAFQRLRCTRTFDLFELLSLLEITKSSIDSRSDPFYESLKLITVDSLTAVVSPLLGGQQTEGHGLMMHLARSLKALAVEYSVAILLTNNQVRGDGTQRKPALGRTWSHVPHCRLLLTHDRSDDASLQTPSHQIRREAKLIKSGRQPINVSCTFKIDDAGICS
ncbi:DNA repair protein RAD51 homolog 4-like [Acanthaster planci]|uniref:DNA repair protein RAD51 homolog 4-like n=1 Tax=Acanthaster planci TaxID=133434 RepID=A0A8B7Y1H2_ACAPL|nr:DNA repair protein RAD51 homolog 4-like [Acanthaster planci]XP_022086371.1 DNA repair protein RAD51 homolog 4-like [Acanthaster planci]XP_022086372.1 DNA repair protein RAD51 homolog 4-like [Acanthaster planci]